MVASLIGIEWDPDSPHESIGLTEEDLAVMGTEELNIKLEEANVPLKSELAKAIKGYASSCRIKREREVERLEEDIRLQQEEQALYEEELRELDERIALGLETRTTRLVTRRLA